MYHQFDRLNMVTVYGRRMFGSGSHFIPMYKNSKRECNRGIIQGVCNFVFLSLNTLRFSCITMLADRNRVIEH